MKQVRWGILGTANIAAVSFLPSLARSTGLAVTVGTRDLERGRAWAERHGVQKAVQGYEAVLADDSLHAIYVPLPNSEHADWTIAALNTGKAVLCEKPLSIGPDEATRVLARAGGRLLWEAFVFPFHPQTKHVQDLVRAGEIGDIREIQACFHVLLESTTDFRRDRELGGGAVFDLGSYAIHFARMILRADVISGVATSLMGRTGVEEESTAVLNFAGGRRLVLSCGFLSQYNSMTRIIGTTGELRIDNPFHPAHDNGVELWRAPSNDWHSARQVWRQNTGRDWTAFDYAVDHIHAVIRGEQAPAHLAVTDSIGTARGVDLVRRQGASNPAT